MNGKKEHSKAVGPRSRGPYTIETLKLSIPALDDLFTKLAAGRQPNFLDILAAISEMVAFYTDHDLPQIELAQNICEMSGKKCLFCS